MSKRIELHDLLELCMKTPHVYFQPPTNVRIKYPAIVYERSDIPKENAGNISYKINYEYKITVIDKNPESDIVDKVAKLPRCRFGTHFVADNLNHDVFYIYY